MSQVPQRNQDLGFALRDLGCRQAAALANDAFADGPGAPRRLIIDDFDPAKPVLFGSPGVESMMVRRYGQAGNSQVTKGTLEGSERRTELSLVRQWAVETFPTVNPDEIDRQASEDIFRVLMPGSRDTTIYAGMFLPWLERQGHQPPPATDDIEARLSRLEERMAAVTAAVLE